MFFKKMESNIFFVREFFFTLNLSFYSLLKRTIAAMFQHSSFSKYCRNNNIKFYEK